ncbi:hypothetical protein BKA62DRAFT_770098 [Auriculariales sp. MPI-PUGE-AT-0066]|nr:hypothetical protein BKA62DRAFT_770098 [Auriculariales sp. MPI-PUGE-AT-0066]
MGRPRLNLTTEERAQQRREQQAARDAVGKRTNRQRQLQRRADKRSQQELQLEARRQSRCQDARAKLVPSLWKVTSGELEESLHFDIDTVCRALEGDLARIRPTLSKWRQLAEKALKIEKDIQDGRERCDALEDSFGRLSSTLTILCNVAAAATKSVRATQDLWYQDTPQLNALGMVSKDIERVTLELDEILIYARSGELAASIASNYLTCFLGYVKS